MGYILRESLSGFERTKVATLGSMFTITVAVLLLALFGLLWRNTARVEAMARGSIQMEAFIEEPAGEAKIADIGRLLLADPAVESVEYISKERAAEIFREEFGEDIGSILDFNPLPPSYRIFLREEFRAARAADSLSARIAGIGGIGTVNYRKDLLDFIDRQVGSLRIAGLVVGCLIALSALFLVANTIRLAIHARRKSVQTLKLVGASRMFVRAPFLLEGCILGALGASFAGLILHYLLRWLSTVIAGEFAGFVIVEPVFYVCVLAAGILLGAAGSAISVRRFIGDSVSG
ncbi:MAG TPA: permease-like cell division protein FtsX [Bacteroidota bacterium]|nr:permease-like cell division protein FtsX [Bacteroidota bacterium]